MSRVSLLAPAGFLLLTSCATVGGLRSEPLDRGVAQRYPVTFASVMAVVPDAITAAGLGVEEMKCTQTLCVIIGTKGMTLGPGGSMGSMARVVVEADEETTIVRVLSRRRIADQTGAEDDYSPEILSQIEVRLGLMQI